MLYFEIKTLPNTRIAGMQQRMSLQFNTTPQLWQRFMKWRAISQLPSHMPLLSLQVYSAALDYQNFTAEFTKWAGFEISELQPAPSELEVLEIEAGPYAVFDYDQGPENALAFFTEVFTNTLPNAGLQVDHRIHFERLSQNYTSTKKEQIWIPISKPVINH